MKLDKATCLAELKKEGYVFPNDFLNLEHFLQWKTTKLLEMHNHFLIDIANNIVRVEDELEEIKGSIAIK